MSKKNKLAKKLQKRKIQTVFTPEKSLSMKLYNEGKLQEAEKASAGELKSNPSNPTALYVAGMLSLHRGQLSRAYGFFASAVYIKPKFADAFFELGNISHVQRLPLKAILITTKVQPIFFFGVGHSLS